jgi:hypothetical protein
VAALYLVDDVYELCLTHLTDGSSQPMPQSLTALLQCKDSSIRFGAKTPQVKLHHLLSELDEGQQGRGGLGGGSSISTNSDQMQLLVGG